MNDQWKVLLNGKVFVNEPMPKSFVNYVTGNYPYLDFKAEPWEEADHEVQDQGGELLGSR
jgi:hypothetical protein